MKKTCRFMIIQLMFLMLALNSVAIERKLYTAKNSSEAELKFSGRVQIEWQPTAISARKQIEQQLTHLFGTMAAARLQAVPKGSHQISNVQTNQINDQTYEITYDYVGTIVVENGTGANYKITLPLNPDTVYQAGLVTTSNSIRNLCTDAHYQGEGDFWYFWNPNQYGCPLEINKDYIEINAELKRLANTQKTYPEYSRLVNDQNEIDIDVYFGMDNPNLSINPARSKDINADNYRRLVVELKKRGYKKQKINYTNYSDIINTYKEAFSLELYSKTVSRDQKEIKINIQMYFGPTGINEYTIGFHHLLKRTIEQSSVFIYDGHSGLGGHLNLESIEYAQNFQIQFPSDKYQIYYFNSCSSYPYYNTQYFMRKKSPNDPKGTKNLDILTNGLSTYFSVMTPTNLAILDAIDMWADDRAMISYQELAKSIDSNNLFGVNGDEDNPTE